MVVVIASHTCWTPCSTQHVQLRHGKLPIQKGGASRALQWSDQCAHRGQVHLEKQNADDHKDPGYPAAMQGRGV
jgi:hypothetical protein